MKKLALWLFFAALVYHGAVIFVWEQVRWRFMRWWNRGVDPAGRISP